MPDFIYNWSYYFFIYAFLGWCSEVIYAAVKKGVFVNRGFLNGPFCPIYGFGVCSVILCLTPLKDHIVLVYIFAVLLTSLIEFITGFLLERFFNEKWWDYRDSFLNIKGYVCLPFSLMWGIGCLAVIYWVQPVISRLLLFIPITLGEIALGLILILFFVDVCLTLFNLFKFKQSLFLLDEMEMIMCKASDAIGENITDVVFAAIEGKEKSIQKFDELKEKYNEMALRKGIPNFSELKKRYHVLFNKNRTRIAQRLTKAFPHLKQHRLFRFTEKRWQSIKRNRK